MLSYKAGSWPQNGPNKGEFARGFRLKSGGLVDGGLVDGGLVGGGLVDGGLALVGAMRAMGAIFVSPHGAVLSYEAIFQLRISVAICV